MVDFNPNADYAVKNRKVDEKKTSVIKQNGAYFIQNDDGTYSELTKTRKGNIFHKAKFTRNEKQGLALEKANDNVQVDANAKAEARNAELAEVQQMKTASLEISAPGEGSYTGVAKGVVVTPNGIKQEDFGDNIAFSGISSKELVYTKNRETGKVSSSTRDLNGSDLAEIRNAVDADDSSKDFAMNFKPKPQGVERDKFAGLNKTELLELADMYEDPQALKNIVSNLIKMGDKESAAKISQKIQNLQE